MSASFDQAASQYDANFTDSAIGRLQRGHVYQHLSKVLEESTPENILEINCGTGGDAIWLAEKNLNVMATDISEKMIAVANSKQKRDNLQFETVDINIIDSRFKDKKFNLIFSNFGGLNCLDGNEMAAFFKNAFDILADDGLLFLVIMPRNTVWEQLYFLAKGEFEKAFRRKNQYVVANVDGEKINTYYYNPKETVHLASPDFAVKQLNPIGLFVPPSYLEPFFSNKKRLLLVLDAFEKRTSNLGFLSRYADHYCIVFQKR